MVTVMNREDARCAAAPFSRALPEIAKAVDCHRRLLRQGRTADLRGNGNQRAHRCAGCIGVPSDIRHKSGDGSVSDRRRRRSTGASYGSQRRLGRTGTQRHGAQVNPGKRDVVVGLAASGRTPYTISALRVCRRARARRRLPLPAIETPPLGKMAEIRIEVEVGPEVLTGSTRLKAGTAQKLICNMLTTGAMVSVGYVYSNLMVNLHLKNEKLVERGILILETLAHVDRERRWRHLRKRI